MEVLSAIGSVVGIAGFGIQLAHFLNKYLEVYKNAPYLLRIVFESIDSNTEVLTDIRNLLEREQANIQKGNDPKLFSSKALKDFRKISDKCLTTFWRIEATILREKPSDEEIETRLIDFHRKLGKTKTPVILQVNRDLRLSRMDRWRWTFSINEKLKEYSQYLDRRQWDLVLMLQVVNLGHNLAVPNLKAPLRIHHLVEIIPQTAMQSGIRESKKRRQIPVDNSQSANFYNLPQRSSLPIPLKKHYASSIPQNRFHEGGRLGQYHRESRHFETSRVRSSISSSSDRERERSSNSVSEQKRRHSVSGDDSDENSIPRDRNSNRAGIVNEEERLLQKILNLEAIIETDQKNAGRDVSNPIDGTKSKVGNQSDHPNQSRFRQSPTRMSDDGGSMFPQVGSMHGSVALEKSQTNTPRESVKYQKPSVSEQPAGSSEEEDLKVEPENGIFDLDFGYPVTNKRVAVTTQNVKRSANGILSSSEVYSILTAEGLIKSEEIRSRSRRESGGADDDLSHVFQAANNSEPYLHGVPGIEHRVIELAENEENNEAYTARALDRTQSPGLKSAGNDDKSHGEKFGPAAKPLREDDETRLLIPPKQISTKFNGDQISIVTKETSPTLAVDEEDTNHGSGQDKVDSAPSFLQNSQALDGQDQSKRPYGRAARQRQTPSGKKSHEIPISSMATHPEHKPANRHVHGDRPTSNVRIFGDGPNKSILNQNSEGDLAKSISRGHYSTSMSSQGNPDPNQEHPVNDQRDSPSSQPQKSHADEPAAHSTLVPISTPSKESVQVKGGPTSTDALTSKTTTAKVEDVPRGKAVSLGKSESTNKHSWYKKHRKYGIITQSPTDGTRNAQRDASSSEDLEEGTPKATPSPIQVKARGVNWKQASQGSGISQSNSTDVSISAYVIKNGRAHQIPCEQHFLSHLSLLKTSEVNDWWKDLAVLDSKDLSILEELLRADDKDSFRTLIDLKLLKRGRFRKNSGQQRVLIALVSDTRFDERKNVVKRSQEKDDLVPKDPISNFRAKEEQEASGEGERVPGLIVESDVASIEGSHVRNAATHTIMHAAYTIQVLNQHHMFNSSTSFEPNCRKEAFSEPDITQRISLLNAAGPNVIDKKFQLMTSQSREIDRLIEGLTASNEIVGTHWTLAQLDIHPELDRMVPSITVYLKRLSLTYMEGNERIELIPDPKPSPTQPIAAKIEGTTNQSSKNPQNALETARPRVKFEPRGRSRVSRYDSPDSSLDSWDSSLSALDGSLREWDYEDDVFLPRLHRPRTGEYLHRPVFDRTRRPSDGLYTSNARYSVPERRTSPYRPFNRSSSSRAAYDSRYFSASSRNPSGPYGYEMSSPFDGDPSRTNPFTPGSGRRYFDTSEELTVPTRGVQEGYVPSSARRSSIYRPSNDNSDLNSHAIRERVPLPYSNYLEPAIPLTRPQMPYPEYYDGKSFDPYNLNHEEQSGEIVQKLLKDWTPAGEKAKEKEKAKENRGKGKERKDRASKLGYHGTDEVDIKSEKHGSASRRVTIESASDSEGEMNFESDDEFGYRTPYGGVRLDAPNYYPASTGRGGVESVDENLYPQQNLWDPPSSREPGSSYVTPSRAGASRARDFDLPPRPAYTKDEYEFMSYPGRRHHPSHSHHPPGSTLRNFPRPYSDSNDIIVERGSGNDRHAERPLIVERGYEERALPSRTGMSRWDSHNSSSRRFMPAPPLPPPPPPVPRRQNSSGAAARGGPRNVRVTWGTATDSLSYGSASDLPPRSRVDIRPVRDRYNESLSPDRDGPSRGRNPSHGERESSRGYSYYDDEEEEIDPDPDFLEVIDLTPSKPEVEGDGKRREKEIEGRREDDERVGDGEQNQDEAGGSSASVREGTTAEVDVKTRRRAAEAAQAEKSKTDQEQEQEQDRVVFWQ